MNQRRQTALYISLLSSLLISAREKREKDAKETFLQIARHLREDFCPPFDRASLLALSSDLYALALNQKRYVTDKEDERFFSLFLRYLESLPHISSPEYSLDESEELISVCAKKSRTPQGHLYLDCVRSLLFLTGNAL